MRLDHLLSKDKEYVGDSFSFECSKHSKKRIKFNRGLKLSWLERTPDKREVDGSSPFRPTIYFLT